jgi:hypothetical protein
MATLIFFMLCGRGAQSFARTIAAMGVEYTDLRASCQIKKVGQAHGVRKKSAFYNRFSARWRIAAAIPELA